MGLKDSSLTYTYDPRRCQPDNFTSGVLPMAPRMLSYFAVNFLDDLDGSGAKVPPFAVPMGPELQGGRQDAQQARASSSAPWIKLDLRRRRNSRPMTYRPGASTTPPWCRMPPCDQYRNRQPAVIWAETGRPNHRANAFMPEI